MVYIIKTWHVKAIRDIVDTRWPGRTVWSNYTCDNSTKAYAERYVQVQTSFPVMTVHYEYICSHWELHIEPVTDGFIYPRIARYLKDSVNDEKIIWGQDGTTTVARYDLEVNIEDNQEVECGLNYIASIFDDLLVECASRFRRASLDQKYESDAELQFVKTDDEVTLKRMSIEDVFGLCLTIPDYQRIYCWHDNNIQTLWDNLTEMPDNQEYHLGSIILQTQQDGYHIIDGQQRLVTLTLLLRALGYEGSMPLLRHRFQSKDACDNISNAKYVIKEILDRQNHDNDLMLKKIISNLTFSVLLLNSDNLDLAYTFFSNQNSRGVGLSDYDILKAHHLRYMMSDESQSERLARQWNKLSQEFDDDNDKIVHKTLGVHLFRLRKWMRKQSCDRWLSDRYVKDEYSADPVIPGIPPFGEEYCFYEKIQGGAHFFKFAELFVDKYREFVRTPLVKMLRTYLLGESHWKYESVIETVLFAYFCKFGDMYLCEALFCIAGVIAQHRYSCDRVLAYKLHEYVQHSELVMMIDQASSPTFFLAETLPQIKISGKMMMDHDIKTRFYECLRRVFTDIQSDFTVAYIEKKMKSEYEQE